MPPQKASIIEPPATEVEPQSGEATELLSPFVGAQIVRLRKEHATLSAERRTNVNELTRLGNRNLEIDSRLAAIKEQVDRLVWNRCPL
jgi:hypothetical protein